MQPGLGGVIGVVTGHAQRHEISLVVPLVPVMVIGEVMHLQATGGVP